MPLPTLTDAEADAIIAPRIKALLIEKAQHQANALAQGDEFDAAVAADTTASTPASRARLRAAKQALAATADAIATLDNAAAALDKIANGTVDSAKRLKNRANQAISTGKALVIPDEVA